jgi:hypothetical protein
MGRPYEHVFLTRFNIPFGSRPFPSRAWMENRLFYFRQVCLPSMQHQTDQDFQWLFLLSPQTPPDLIEYLESLSQTRPFKLCFTEMKSRALYPLAIEKHVPPSDFLISSRLDSDDALGKHFVSSVKQHFNFQDFEWVDHRRGLILSQRKLWRVQQRNNMFLSLIERRSSSKSVYLCQHMDASKHGSVSLVDGSRQWLRLLHQKNTIGTKRRGVAVPGVEVRKTLSDYPPDIVELVKRRYRVGREGEVHPLHSQGWVGRLRSSLVMSIKVFVRSLGVPEHLPESVISVTRGIRRSGAIPPHIRAGPRRDRLAFHGIESPSSTGVSEPRIIRFVKRDVANRSHREVQTHEPVGKHRRQPSSSACADHQPQSPVIPPTAGH